MQFSFPNSYSPLERLSNFALRVLKAEYANVCMYICGFVNSLNESRIIEINCSNDYERKHLAINSRVCN